MFPLSEVKGDSPRLAWLKRHDVRTIDHGTGGTCETTGDYKRWLAYTGDLLDVPPPGSYAEGDTEQEALCELAKRRGWRLWNETGI